MLVLVKCDWLETEGGITTVGETVSGTRFVMVVSSGLCSRVAQWFGCGCSVFTMISGMMQDDLIGWLRTMKIMLATPHS